MEEKLQLLLVYMNEYYIDWMAHSKDGYWIEKEEYELALPRKGYSLPDKEYGNIQFRHYRYPVPMEFEQWLEKGMPKFKYRP